MHRGMYVTDVIINTEQAKTKANKFGNNFVHFFKFAVRRERILGNIKFKSICRCTIIAKCLSIPFEVKDSLRKDTCDNDQVC